MNDYISREEALAVFGDIHPQDYNAIAYRTRIKKIHAADVRPVVRGEWLWNGDGMYYFCSCCNYRAFGCTLEIRDGEYGFCPNCGTDMREEVDGNV